MIIRNMIFAAALAGFVLNIAPAQALEVNKVQLGIKVDKYGKCPRSAVLKIWAHTNGPGQMTFRMHSANGTQTGELNATAVKGAAGTYLATYSQNITIATNVDTSYQATETGSHKLSNWVPLKARCGPGPVQGGAGKRTSNPIKGKHISDINRPQPKMPGKGNRTTSAGQIMGKKKVSKKIPNRAGSRGKPVGKPVGKPTNGSNAKPINTCKSKRISVTRTGAVTKKGGIITAIAAWKLTTGNKYGLRWQYFRSAADRHQSCRRVGALYSCKVSARPCKG